jgi:hypothetical protein
MSDAFWVGAAMAGVVAVGPGIVIAVRSWAMLRRAKRMHRTATERLLSTGQTRQSLADAREAYERHLPLMHEMSMQLNQVYAPCDCRYCVDYRQKDQGGPERVVSRGATPLAPEVTRVRRPGVASFRAPQKG